MPVLRILLACLALLEIHADELSLKSAQATLSPELANAKRQIHTNIARNRKYRRLKEKIDEFVAGWQVECKLQGLTLQPSQDGYLSCQAQPPPRQPPPESRPEPHPR